MYFITILAVALGLSFDTFAVSLSFGVVRNGIVFRDACGFGLLMAVFQAGFLVAGFFLGSLVSSFMQAADHWVALVLLAILGIRMFISGLKNDGAKGSAADYNSPMALVSMGVGTSIDAFAVGISFALLSIAIWYSALIIGVVTFLASMTAIRIGKSAGARLGSRVEIIGGLILVAIGIKIFLEHTLAA